MLDLIFIVASLRRFRLSEVEATEIGAYGFFRSWMGVFSYVRGGGEELLIFSEIEEIG